MTLIRRLLTGPLSTRFSEGRRSRRETRHAPSRSLAPRVEMLETIELLSHVRLPIHAGKAKHAPAPAPAIDVSAVPFAPIASAAQQIITASSIKELSLTTTQTVTVVNTLTNFNQPFAPPVALFNPALGTLVSVSVTETANLSSQITSQNLSTTVPATIVGYVNGGFAITGVNPSGTALAGPLLAITAPVTVTANAGDPPFGGTSTSAFGTLAASRTATFTYTSPSDLAFYTANGMRTTITPTLVENAQAGASAPNGNLQTQVATRGSGSISIVYKYAQALPAVTKVVRFGIHQQTTHLFVTFAGPLDPNSASNPAYYTVIQPNRKGSFTGLGTRTIPIVSAAYNASTFTLDLVPASRLNFHNLYQLKIGLPGTNGTPVVIEFGGPNSLGGFTNHQGQPVFV